MKKNPPTSSPSVNRSEWYLRNGKKIIAFPFRFVVSISRANNSGRCRNVRNCFYAGRPGECGPGVIRRRGRTTWLNVSNMNKIKLPLKVLSGFKVLFNKKAEPDESARVIRTRVLRGLEVAILPNSMTHKNNGIIGV